MKKLTILSGIALGFFLTLTLASLPNSAHAQKKMVMSVGGEGIEGQPFIIPELGAIVVFKEKKLEVLNVMPDNARPKDYLEVDIKAGDILVMLNGARLKTIEDLKSAHDSASAGDNFKFGIKRGKEMRILQFAKADPKSMPKGHAMTMSMDAEGGGGKPLAVLMGSGIIAEESDGKIVIGALMPDASDIFADAFRKVIGSSVYRAPSSTISIR
jgi:hypothetical protein